MRAAVLEAEKKIVIREVPDPKIGPKDVLVRSGACGICGTDVHIWEGEFFPTYPLVPGHEVAGEIVEIGGEGRDLKTGDRGMVDPTLTCEERHFCMTQPQNQLLSWDAVGVTPERRGWQVVRVSGP